MLGLFVCNVGTVLETRGFHLEIVRICWDKLEMSGRNKYVMISSLHFFLVQGYDQKPKMSTTTKAMTVSM